MAGQCVMMRDRVSHISRPEVLEHDFMQKCEILSYSHDFTFGSGCYYLKEPCLCILQTKINKIVAIKQELGASIKHNGPP